MGASGSTTDESGICGVLDHQSRLIPASLSALSGVDGATGKERAERPNAPGEQRAWTVEGAFALLRWEAGTKPAARRVHALERVAGGAPPLGTPRPAPRLVTA